MLHTPKSKHQIKEGNIIRFKKSNLCFLNANFDTWVYHGTTPDDLFVVLGPRTITTKDAYNDILARDAESQLSKNTLYQSTSPLNKNAIIYLKNLPYIVTGESRKIQFYDKISKDESIEGIEVFQLTGSLRKLWVPNFCLTSDYLAKANK